VRARGYDRGREEVDTRPICTTADAIRTRPISARRRGAKIVRQARIPGPSEDLAREVGLSRFIYGRGGSEILLARHSRSFDVSCLPFRNSLDIVLAFRQTLPSKNS